MAKQTKDDRNWHLANAKSGFLNLKGMLASCQLSHGKVGRNLRRVKFALWMPVLLLMLLFLSGLLDETFAQDYCASQGNNVSYEWIDKVTIGSFSKVSGSNGGYADLTDQIITLTTGSHNIELTPGFQYGSYTEYWRIWIDLNQDGLFASEETVFSGTSTSSNSIYGQIIVSDGALAGNTRLRVAMRYGAAPSSCGSFTYGEVEDYTVHIDPGETEGGGDEEVVVPNLCDSEGTNASYEWIQKVDFGSFSNDSGSNGGFGDFTNQAVDLSTGPNPVTLTPGFKYSSYNEYWNIWIDLDQDHNFSANELLYSGSSRSTIFAEIEIPDETLPGNTGMRVSMKYGAFPAACGTFTWGEVEDYTVNISLSDIDTTPPVVSITNPANNAIKVPVIALIKVGFSEPMDPETITTATFVVNDGSSDFEGTVWLQGTTAIFTPAVSLNYDTTYTAIVTTGAKDLAGNALQSDYLFSFTTVHSPDTTPPTITAVSPADGAVGVDVGAVFTASFSEPMDESSVTGSFYVMGGSGNVPGTVTFDGVSATFTPSVPLEYGLTYTVTILSALKDLAGNPLQDSYAWSFTTEPAPDILPPAIVTTTPAGGAIDIPVSAAVSVTFSEPIDPATLTTASFVVKEDSILEIAGEVTVNGTTAIFIPAAPLNYQKTYDAMITTEVKDIAGNPIEADYIWSFVTESYFYIKGKVLVNSVGLQGVTLTLTGDASMSTTTDTKGTFKFEGLTPGNYMVTPFKNGHTFAPETMELSVVDADIPYIAFEGLPVPPEDTFNIKGQVLGDSGGLEGVSVDITGNASMTATTNAAGTFQFEGLSSGSYTVTPSMTGCTFTPESMQLAITDSDISGIEFFVSVAPVGGGGAEQKLVAGDGAELDHFGGSVSISGDTAVVGASGDDDNGSESGSVYIFENIDGVWTEAAKLIPSDGEILDVFGGSVSISGDHVIVGAHLDSTVNGSYSGSAYIFEKINGVWMEKAKLIASDGDSADWFGCSVSISGDKAIVGAMSDDDNGTDFGSAYIFEKINGVWTEVAKLTSGGIPIGQFHPYFGASVSISGDKAIVGAEGDDGIAQNSGAAYIFEKIDGVWAKTAKIAPFDGKSHDYFGSSVSISDNRAIVGAHGDDGLAPYPGAAYVFENVEGVWTEVSYLNASDGNAGDRFGTSVSISGDLAIVGADGTNANGPASGSAYFFMRFGNAWMEVNKVNAFDGDIENYFGSAVAIDGKRAIVGAPGDDDNGPSSGSAYIYQHKAPYTITGHVYQDGIGIEGLGVTLMGWGPTINTTTDADGAYSFDIPEKGLYTVKPESAIHSFNPAMTEVEIVDDNQVIEVNFEAESLLGSGVILHVPDEYPTIQAAVDAAADGYTILVESGTYYENVDVNKGLTIKSLLGYETTTVVASVPDDHVFDVMAEDVTVEGFTIYGATGADRAGVYIGNGGFNSNISNNRIGYTENLKNFYGIRVFNSNGSVISENECLFNELVGIRVELSVDVTVSNNVCLNNGASGIFLDGVENNNVVSNEAKFSDRGIVVHESTGNVITENICFGNALAGMFLEVSTANSITQNYISNNAVGLEINGSNENEIYLNSFFGEFDMAVSSNGWNVWNISELTNYTYGGLSQTGYMGNYYSDHLLVDSDGDGITDNPYEIPGEGVFDEYPLVTTSNNYTLN